MPDEYPQPTDNTVSATAAEPAVKPDILQGVTDEQISFIRTTLHKEIENDFQHRLEIWKNKEFANFRDGQDAQVKRLVFEYMENEKKARQPLTPEEIQKLLDQDYLTFTIKLRMGSGDNNVKECTIRELPSEIEHKFYRVFKERVKDKMSDLAALALETMDQGMEKRLQAFFNTFDGAFDVLADATVLVLNPFGDDSEITLTWVKKNLSMIRQWNICQAQIEVNRLRDFFSKAFLAGTQVGTMATGLDSQQLQVLLRK
jgi:hypothetical protein